MLAAVIVNTSLGVELHLRNGDRLTGTLVGRADGKILFRSPILGDISIPEDQGVIVDTPDTPVESLAGLPPAAATLPKPTSSASVTPGEQPPKNPWKGKLEMGFNQQSGRTDTVQLSLRADAEKKAGINSYRFEGRALYSEQYQQTTSDRYDGQFRWRHELSQRVFSQALSSYQKDRVKQIFNNIEQNVGLGYRLFERPRHSANVGAGATGQYRSALGVESGVTYLGEVFEDYTYKLTGRLTILQDANISYSPETRSRYTLTGQNYIPTDDSAANYRLRFNTALQGKVSERVSLNLRFEYEFDNAILDPKAKADQRITTSLGYAF
jgi:putative salt-induced outer membrane protein YdiY